MPSSALIDWQSVAAARLDQLESIHVKATGGGPGRRWETAQLNRSLMVALVAQFQAFCRDLHDCAVQIHVGAAIAEQKSLMQVLMTEGRKLDVGNPRKSALGADFGRLGLSFIPALKLASADTESQLDDLDTLVDFRNAVSHADESRIAAIESAGRVRATKLHFSRNRKMLGALAVTMDEVVADQIATLLGIAEPW